MKEENKKYPPQLNALISYVQKFIKSLSTQGIYIILLLYFAFKNKSTPVWAKNIIIGSLAYFLSPFDSIPDLTPFLGMTDDLGVLSFGLVTIACYVDDEVRENAKKQLVQVLGDNIDESAVQYVNEWL